MHRIDWKRPAFKNTLVSTYQIRAKRRTAGFALLIAKQHLLDLGHEEELMNQFLEGREDEGEETGVTRAINTFGTPDWNGDGWEVFARYTGLFCERI